MPTVEKLPRSQTFSGAYNVPWFSSFSDFLKPQIKPELLRENGYAENMVDWLEAANLHAPLSSDTLELHYKGDVIKTQQISAEISTTAADGDSVSIVVADDQDSSGNPTVRKGEGLLIPGDYTSTGVDEVYVVESYDSGTDTLTATPLNGTAQIDVAVPADTHLKIHGYYTARGTDQPQGTTFNYYKRSFQTTILKESKGFVGGLQAQEWWVVKDDSGNPIGLWSEGLLQAEILLKHKKNDALFYSQLNTNDDLTETSSRFGGTGARKATKGMWNHGEDEGLIKNKSGPWTISDFYDIKDLKRSQNLTTNDFAFWTGSDLFREVEQSSLEFIKEFSGGTSLLDAGGKLGINVKEIEVDGQRFALAPILGFDNPNSYGGNAYKWIQRGIMVPSETASVRSVRGEESRQPMLQIGYLNNRGEDRTRVSQVVNGITNYTDYASNTSDGHSHELLCELMTILMHPNHLILVK